MNYYRVYTKDGEFIVFGEIVDTSCATEITINTKVKYTLNLSVLSDLPDTIHCKKAIALNNPLCGASIFFDINDTVWIVGDGGNLEEGIVKAFLIKVRSVDKEVYYDVSINNDVRTLPMSSLFPSKDAALSHLIALNS